VGAASTQGDRGWSGPAATLQTVGVGIADGERLHVEDVAAVAVLADRARRRGRRVWLVSWKRGTGRPAITYEQAIEEALTVGWVDSTAGTLDDERSMLWFAPRKRGSGWSRPNKQRLERLARGRQDAGTRPGRGGRGAARRLVDAARRRGGPRRAR
jgi:hypothetical protein